MKKSTGNVTENVGLRRAARRALSLNPSRHVAAPHYEATVIGVSSGGMEALSILLPLLSKQRCQLAVLIVQHLHPHSKNYLPLHLDRLCEFSVKEVDEKEYLHSGIVYVAPANYHLLVEADKTVALSSTQKVNYARPSIDVLFETAAEVYRESLVGIILTGANSDGSLGLKRVKEYGGLTIVQDPETAESPSMPRSALRTTKVDYVLTLPEIGNMLNTINRNERIYETTAVDSCD